MDDYEPRSDKRARRETLVTKFRYDDSAYGFVDPEADDDPQGVFNRLRALATSGLLPPRLQRYAELLSRPVPRGRRALPRIFLAAVMVEHDAADEPRTATLARRYHVAESTVRGWLFKARNKGLDVRESERVLASDPRTPDMIIDAWLSRANSRRSRER